jgi:GNAT superfamily N-acetyltransferase
VLSFSIEEFGPFYREAIPLISADWENLSDYGDDSPLSLNVPVYQVAQDKGILKIFTIRDDERLVGYMSFFLGTNLHYSTTKWATSDAMWVDPSARRPRVAGRFLDFIEKSLKDSGALFVSIGCKIRWPALARLLESRGYDRIDVILSKRL